MSLLQGITIIDFTQLLSGPSTSLRLADLGARVIKIERPGVGDLCRQLYVSNCDIGGESSLFQAINRNKESICLDLKNDMDKAKALKLIQQADVVLSNFRPDVMNRLGLDYKSLKAMKPDIVYGEITGYGDTGDWKDLPGQDLLLQALSGLTWHSGNAEDGPVPMGVAIADILAGSQLTQGIIAALYHRDMTGEGSKISVSMLEAMLDFQFEALTLYYNDHELPLRTKTNSAHPLVGGAYGLYGTSDGYIAVSMGNIAYIGELIGCETLSAFNNPDEWFIKRDDIKAILNEHLKSNTSAYWLSILEPADIWCADVLDMEEFLNHPGFSALDMLQSITLSNGMDYTTTRCPIRIDGKLLYADKAPPVLGEHQDAIINEFNLGEIDA
jgi:crotonobetainyl-CoA:carnitine CoA-transferase CaiB-like acyl-CoA transferase